MYIKEFAKLIGVHPDTIKRNYIKNGILPDRRDRVNNYRVFTTDDVELIRKLKPQLKGKNVQPR